MDFGEAVSGWPCSTASPTGQVCEPTPLPLLERPKRILKTMVEVGQEVDAGFHVLERNVLRMCDGIAELPKRLENITMGTDEITSGIGQGDAAFSRDVSADREIGCDVESSLKTVPLTDNAPGQPVRVVNEQRPVGVGFERRVGNPLGFLTQNSLVGASPVIVDGDVG